MPPYGASDRGERGIGEGSDDADEGPVTRPSPPTLPTSAEIGLVLTAKYETDLHIQAAQATRRLHMVGILVTMAVAVLGYDVLSVVLR